ncbi:hypothetical protein GGI23_003147 [Coemansia sp. RSA 2559]|nr:hypothetical protein GGI23_003147 [Coemansia sp. RSA 2559]
MSGIVWPQEIKVNGRRRPVSEFQRLQERAALAGSLVDTSDDHAMRRVGLVNNSTIYDSSIGSSSSSMHCLQTGYQRPESVLRSPIMYDKQNTQESQSPTSTQDYIKIPSFVHEGRDAVAASAADIAPAAGLFPVGDYNLLWNTLNSLLSPVSVGSCVPETAEPALSGTMADSTISSSISSPVARYQTVEYAAVPTGDAAQLPLILHDIHESVSEDKDESQSQETTTCTNSNETHSNIAIKLKRASCKRRGIGKRNREPTRTSPTFTPHAQAELRKMLRDIRSNPFPDVGMVTSLCKRLGLSNRQVRNWFAVHRFRDMFNIEVDGVKEWRFRESLV